MIIIIYIIISYCIQNAHTMNLLNVTVKQAVVVFTLVDQKEKNVQKMA